MDQVEALRQTEDPAARARQASQLVSLHQDAITEISAIRREALDELVAQGLTHKEIASLIGATRARVGQLLSSGPQPERALFGSGTITIAVGGKPEPGRANPSTMVSAETFGAYEKLAKAAGELGLKTEYEVIPPPGLVHLNRANLIVLTSPRLLPLVGQVLEADPHIGFTNDESGWFLTNRTTGEDFRSPSDAGEHADYGYIGRLPRPDRSGTFLYVAGIHAMGTLGSATYLAENVDTIYKEVKRKRWSALVRCDYAPDTRTVTSTTLATPIYRHEGF